MGTILGTVGTLSSEGCNGRYLLDWDTAPFSWFLISLSHLLAASGLRGIVGDEGWLCPRSPRPNHAQPRRRRCCTSQAWWWWAVQWLWWCGDWILMWTSEWLMRPRFLLWPGEHCCRHSHVADSSGLGLVLHYNPLLVFMSTLSTQREMFRLWNSSQYTCIFLEKKRCWRWGK